jgi:hypothetical protein
MFKLDQENNIYEGEFLNVYKNSEQCDIEMYIDYIKSILGAIEVLPDEIGLDTDEQISINSIKEKIYHRIKTAEILIKAKENE